MNFEVFSISFIVDLIYLVKTITVLRVGGLPEIRRNLSRLLWSTGLTKYLTNWVWIPSLTTDSVARESYSSKLVLSVGRKVVQYFFIALSVVSVVGEAWWPHG